MFRKQHIMEIVVYSRATVEAMDAHQVPHLIISINCPGEDAATIKTNRATLARSDHWFWDLDKPDPNRPGLEEFLIQPSDAKQIVDMVDAHPDAERIIVHCTAGRSRSAGVAAALLKALTGNDDQIFKNSHYFPNMRVYRMVLEAYYDKHPPTGE